MDSDGWTRATAEVDQALAALKGTEYEILRFQEATKTFTDALIEQGIQRIQAANIINGMALAAIFPEYE